MKNLENYGVQEMNAMEMIETGGGFLGALFVAIIIVAAIIFARDGKENTATYVNGQRVGN